MLRRYTHLKVEALHELQHETQVEIDDFENLLGKQ